MKKSSVYIDNLRIEYNTEGIFTSEVSKDYSDIVNEIDVFYKDTFEKTEVTEDIPITIFSQSLSSLQAIVKYLHENKKLSFSEISKLINRDPRTIWTTYDSVKNLKLKTISTKTLVPVQIFSNRNFSTLESLVKYLLDFFSVKEISNLLSKDYKTIWTIKDRIKKKGGATNE